jgi:hypothetical protein
MNEKPCTITPCYSAHEETLTAQERPRIANLIGARCTGIEAVYRLRQRAGLTRHTAVVGAIGSTFTLMRATIVELYFRFWEQR